MVILITFNVFMNLYKNFTRCIQVRIAKFPPQLLSSKEERDQENDLLTIFYVSAYSPQLGKRLKISHTKLSIIALAGNGAEFSSIFQQPT
jgi:hypothetical protein